MAKLRQGNIVWNFVTAGQYVGDQSKMHGDQKLRCNLCGHLFQGGSLKAACHFTQAKFCKAGGMRVLAELSNGTDFTFVPSNAQRVQRWMADDCIRDTRAPTGGQRLRMDDAERDEIQDALDEEGRECGAREGGWQTREKRARQTTIDEMYSKEKLAAFTDAWLQWIYVNGLPFNAFCGPELQKVRQTAERVPQSIQFRFPTFSVTAGAGIPSQRAKVATMLMRRVDVPKDMIEPCVREVAIRNLHMLEPAHAAAHLLNPRRRSLTYYHSLEMTTDDRCVVVECDRFLLAQIGGDPVGRLYKTVRDQMRAFHSRRGDWGGDLFDLEEEDCRGDSETERCAAWWFEHGRAHPELRTIAIRLVEIATNLKLASCARQGGGYVLPWVMGTRRGGMAAEDEDEDGDVEPEVWGARPAGCVPEVEIERQIVAFQHSRPSRAHSVRDVFGIRATEVRPWPEGGDDVDAIAADDDIDDEWTDDDDTPVSSDPTTERVYFMRGRMLSWAVGPLVGGMATARPRVMRDRVSPCVAEERVDPVEMGIPRVSVETMDRTEMMTTTTVPRTMCIGSPWC
ncbi:hypothetical protein CBR_g39782 [Chara braunii]|uniref:Uncharacterized protein n=1 Tax=Chara braunii TaxID=69332 RepID=A0A388LSA2_CHABU|nr:hypothetical protein CBR_g39782 [Chara braunii]|eukprot:GBG85216.1 hypothetical protein CBR_g39782 [Chara braunii]